MFQSPTRETPLCNILKMRYSCSAPCMFQSPTRETPLCNSPLFMRVEQEMMGFQSPTREMPLCNQYVLRRTRHYKGSFNRPLAKRPYATTVIEQYDQDGTLQFQSPTRETPLCNCDVAALWPLLQEVSIAHSRNARMQPLHKRDGIPGGWKTPFARGSFSRASIPHNLGLFFILYPFHQPGRTCERLSSTPSQPSLSPNSLDRTSINDTNLPHPHRCF